MRPQICCRSGSMELVCPCNGTEEGEWVDEKPDLEPHPYFFHKHAYAISNLNQFGLVRKNNAALIVSFPVLQWNVNRSVINPSYFFCLPHWSMLFFSNNLREAKKDPLPNLIIPWVWGNQIRIWQQCELSTERGLEDHEHMVEPLSAWTRDSENKVLFQQREDKYAIFKDPQVNPLTVASDWL